MRYLIPILALSLAVSCANVDAGTSSTDIAGLATPSEIPAGVHDVLANATEFEIYALHPAPYAIEQDGLEDAPLFFEYAQLGNATLTEAAIRRETVSAIYSGIEKSDGRVAACFNPRHGLHAEADGHTVDFVICYECLSMHIYLDGDRHQALTAKAPGAALTKIWNDAGLTIHKD